MQHLYSFSQICVNRDHFHNIAVCMHNFSKTQSQTFSVFSTSLLQNKLRFLALYTTQVLLQVKWCKILADAEYYCKNRGNEHLQLNI